MAKTSRDARRHIQALSEFLSTGGISREAMEEILKESKKRKHLKQSLRRLVAKGFILDDGRKYSPTAEGVRFFRRFIKDAAEPMSKAWDKKWRLIAFDVPCKCDEKRDKIRGLLKEFDFYQLQKSVWICPTALSGLFWETMVKEELDGYCKTMVVDVLEGDEELKEHFHVRLD
jgi:DNA-binding transcriptional regulator PaaX